MSRAAYGKGAIAVAYFSSPTRRYDHGILGDKIEAAGLTVVLEDGSALVYTLPSNRVFEDLQPRLVDLDGDGTKEIVVVESDIENGASLAVYGLKNGAIEKIASTPFIGHTHRWLNPLGTGNFNGDSVTDLALVLTPHIGGILQLYSYTPPRLTLYAQKSGVSTHSIGSTSLGMGRVVKGEKKDLILAPNQRHNALLLLEWVNGEIVERASITLHARIISELMPTGPNRWTMQLEDRSYRSVKAVP